MAKLHQTPWGFSVKEDTIREIDKRVKKGQELVRKSSTVKITTEPDSWTDTSVISTETPDHDGEVMLLSALDTSFFLKHPRVMLDHNYSAPPVGWCRSLKLIENQLIAKTQFIKRPEGVLSDWMPEILWAFVSHDPCLLPAKSIGAMSRRRPPTRDEIAKRPDWKDCTILDDSVLLEYSVVTFGANPDCNIISVAKSLTRNPDTLKRLGLDKLPPKPKKAKAHPDFNRMLEVEILKRLEDIDVDDIVKRVLRGA